MNLPKHCIGCECLDSRVSILLIFLSPEPWCWKHGFIEEKRKKNMCCWNAGATSKYNSVKTHAPAIMGCIIDINKLCSCWSYHLGSFIMQTKILALMANCEMFVNPEWLNHGILLKCAVLFSNSATCGLPEFSTPDTFHHGMLSFLLRGARWVRILWHFAYIYSTLQTQYSFCFWWDREDRCF